VLSKKLVGHINEMLGQHSLLLKGHALFFAVLAKPVVRAGRSSGRRERSGALSYIRACPVVGFRRVLFPFGILGPEAFEFRAPFGKAAVKVFIGCHRLRRLDCSLFIMLCLFAPDERCCSQHQSQDEENYRNSP